MKTIVLTQGQSALVDDEDYLALSRYTWFASRRCANLWYARTNITVNGKRTTELMHRFVMDAPKNKEVDHKNGDGLDNQKSNLRCCSHKDNGRNRRTQRRFKGVWTKRSGRFTAAITLNDKTIHIGRYDTENEAARAYDAKAQELFGEFARLNFPTERN